MKRVLLTSSGLFITTHDIDHLLPQKLTQCRMAYITTAAKGAHDIGYVSRQKEQMDAKGFDYTEMDIEDKTQRELEAMLLGYDVVMVEGGNTFYLLKAVRASHFDIVIKKLIKAGVVYIGSSAGSYITCPSIAMATWSDRGFDRFGITEYEAMNVVPFYIKAHYTVEMKALLDEKAPFLDYPLYALSDEQAIFVIDEQVELLGEGPSLVWNNMR